MTSASPMLGHRAHDVYEDLRRQIHQGLVSSGERLPPQRALADEYAVCITTVNKAISRLQDEDLVWSKRGAGVFVRGPQRANAADVRIISYMYMYDGESLTPVQNAALERGYLLSVFSQLQSEWNPHAERLFLQQVRDQRHQALLAFCSPTEPRNDDLLRELVTASVRVIHIEHYRTELPEQAYILPDYRRAARMAAVDLTMAGYERLYFFGHPANSSPACALIHQGLKEARDDYQAPLTDDYFIQVPAHDAFPDYETGMTKLMARVPVNSAIVLLGNGNYERVSKALANHNRRIPEDIGLMAISIPDTVQAPVDQLAFDRQAMVRRAIRAASAEVDPELRELVRPARIIHGTVR